MASLRLRPRIAQRNRAIEHETTRTVIALIGDEVSVALELEPVLGDSVLQRPFDEGGDDAL
jgi:hypothetical protein